MYKSCTKCNVELPFSAFTNHAAGKYGLASRCRICTSEDLKTRRTLEVKKQNALKAEQRVARNRATNEIRRDELNSHEFKAKSKLCATCKIIKTYFDFGFDFSKQDGHSPRCKTCCSLYFTARYKAKPQIREYQKKWSQENIEVTRAYSRKYYQNNKETRKIYNKNWRENNRELARHLTDLWIDVNRGKINASCKARKKLIKQATPIWANLKDIESVYIYAQMWTILTGIRQSVDHEIPLQGEQVCGLHTYENLRIQPLSKNSSKGNKFDPDTFIGP